MSALREELAKARREIEALRAENARLRGMKPVPAPPAPGAQDASAPVPASSSGSATILPAPLPENTLVTVEDLVSDYRASSIGGDAKYKGRRLRVQGVVQGFRKNFAGLSWVVNLSAGDKLGLVRCQVSFPGISDYRPATESARILEGRRPFREWQTLLQQGDPVTFEGLCVGIDESVVVFKDCKPAK